MVAVDKKERSCKIIDFAVPGDSRIEGKEKYKIQKYQDLALLVSSLGAIPKQFGNRL